MAKISKALLALVFGVFLLVVPSAARAFSGTAYICDVNIWPIPTSEGSQGYFYLSLYSGPSCTGNYLFNGFFCTVGATDPICTYAIPAYMVSGLLSSSIDAARSNQRIFVQTNGQSQAYANIYFYAGGY
jgi:hypothetical protein